jgi:hypothetical protein
MSHTAALDQKRIYTFAWTCKEGIQCTQGWLSRFVKTVQATDATEYKERVTQ